MMQKTKEKEVVREVPERTDHKKFQRQILIYQSALILLSAIMFFLFLPKLQSIVEEILKPSILKQNTDAPHYSEITRYISNLVYSGFPALVRDDVALKVDFDQKTWSLSNVHRFDKNGNALLEEGRYGLCGELADTVFRKVQPMLGDRYQIEFVRAAETGYFLSPRSSHYALRISDKNSPKKYILDPSFKRYGPIDDFDNYVFFESYDHIDLKTNVLFKVDFGTPIMIKKDFIIDLSVDQTDGQFDRNNFSLILAATQQYRFANRYIFSLRLNKGKIEMFENKMLSDWLLDRSQYLELRDKMFQWFENVLLQLNPSFDLTALNTARQKTS